MAIAGTLTYKTELDTSGVKKAGSTVKSIIAGLGITKLISSAMNTIKASTDDAIKRLDTLNNFPKVMSSLGISSKDASDSIKKMSDKLAGLPTTLDQGASAVQRFTSYNGDVKKSTDIFLAVNNAILAGGASAEAQASALEQLTQAYTKGKPEANDWKILMQAMPAQLKQVANTMGYTSTAIGGDFYEALQKGEISMDDFMDTIVELNEKGGDGFESFTKQAKVGTEGIGTAITVAKTQIVKGVTDILDALNKRFEKTSFGSLSGFIANIGKETKVGLDNIAKLITGEMSAIDFGASVIQMITNFITKINEQAPQIITTGMKLISDLIIGLAQGLPQLIPEALKTVITIVESLLDNIDLIIDAGIELILGLIDGLIEATPILIDEIPVIIDKLIQAITRMLPKIMDMGIKLLVKLTEGIIKTIPKLVQLTPQIINAFINGLNSLRNSLIQAGINAVVYLINGFKNKIGDMKNVGRDLINGLWNGIQQRWNNLKSSVENLGSSIVEKFKSVFGIASPSKVFRDQIGKFLSEGIAVGIEANIDSIDSSLDDMYKEMNKTIQTENAKLNLGAMSNGIYDRSLRAVSMDASFNGTIPVQLELDGEKIYDNQQKISLRKSIQYGGAK